MTIPPRRRVRSLPSFESVAFFIVELALMLIGLFVILSWVF